MRDRPSEIGRRFLRSTLPTRLFIGLGSAYTRLLAWRRLDRASFAAFKRAERAGLAGEVAISTSALMYPITLRSGSSDCVEFLHTIVRSTYAVSLPAEPVRLIVDAGANFGDSTAWYLSRFPDATVVAVEPDLANFDVLRRNVAPYGNRTRLHRAALWPDNARLCVRRRNGHSDVFVEETRSGEAADCPSLSPESILAEFPAQDVDIFKCDIEGAEVALFSGPDLQWLRRIRTLYVDAHSAAARRVLENAAETCGFTFQRHRELCVLTRAARSLHD